MTNTRTAIPCTCRGYNPADPCGHGDTAEGCPKHDPNLPQFFCHECAGQMRPCDTDGEEYQCLVCGETILCDECGQPWTDDHACDGDEEEALRLGREENLRRPDPPPANWFLAKDSGRDLSRGAV